MDRTYYIYIMTNARNTVLYTGVTNDLIRRVFEHRMGEGSGFTAKYQIAKLVYYESTEDIESAIAREKQIKAGSRKKKLQMIEQFNPTWKDLGETL